MKRAGLLIAILLAGSLTACSSTKKTVSLDTPETVVPYWIDGVSLCCSRMISKNEYWEQKFKNGKATPQDLIEILRSNNRFYKGLIGRMEAHRYCAAVAREELLAQQKEEE